MNQIWKLQRPLATNRDELMVLAYTEGKQRIAQIPMAEEIIDDIFGDDLKIYVKGTVKNGVLKIKKRIEDQPW